MTTIPHRGQAEWDPEADYLWVPAATSESERCVWCGLVIQARTLAMWTHAQEGDLALVENPEATASAWRHGWVDADFDEFIVWSHLEADCHQSGSQVDPTTLHDQ